MACRVAASVDKHIVSVSLHRMVVPVPVLSRTIDARFVKDLFHRLFQSVLNFEILVLPVNRNSTPVLMPQGILPQRQFSTPVPVPVCISGKDSVQLQLPHRTPCFESQLHRVSFHLFTYTGVVTGPSFHRPHKPCTWAMRLRLVSRSHTCTYRPWPLNPLSDSW